MKRIIATILTAAAILLQMQGLILDVSAEPQTVPKDVYLIEALGITSNSDENIGEEISRAEFLSWVLKMTKIEKQSAGQTPSLSDVTMGHAYADEISTAFAYKIIKGDGNGRFYPDDSINRKDAAVMLINAMGYAHISEVSADIYEKVADAMQLYKGISGRKVLIRRDASVMIYNAMNAPTVTISDAGYDIIDSSKESFMERMWKIFSVRGILDTNGRVSVNGRSINKQKAYIDDVLYNQEDFSVDNLFGQRVKAYYYDIDDEKTIAYAYAEGTNVVCTEENELNKFENNEFSFDNNGKDKKYKINADTTVVWNNRVIGSKEFDAKLNSKSAEFTFIDNNDDGTCEFVIVREGVVYVPELLDKEKLCLGGTDCPKLELKEYKGYSISDLDGNPVDFSDIKKTDVVLAYDPGDLNCFLELCLIADSSSHTVKSVDSSGEDTVKLEDGLEYRVAANSKTSVEEIDIDTSYTLWFDRFNRIVYAKLESYNGYAPMYIIRAAQKEDDTVVIKGLSVDGEVKPFTCAEKMRYRTENGKISNISSAELYKKITDSNGKTRRQLVLIRQNTEEKITSVYLVSNNPNDIFFDPNPSIWNAYRWLVANYSFENLIQLKANTKVFFVPYTDLEDQDDEYYYVGDVGMFRNDSAYQNRAYYQSAGYGFYPITMKPNAMESDYIVIECPEDTKFTSGSSSYGVITKMNPMYDENYEENCFRLTLLNMYGVEQQFSYFPSDGEEAVVGIGDIVQIMTSSGKVQNRDINMYYDYSINEWDWITNWQNTIGWRYYAPFRVTEGSLQRKENGIMKCNIMTYAGSYHDEYVRYGGSKLLRFEGTKGKYTLMDGSNVSVGENFFLMMSNGTAQMFIDYGELAR